MGTKFILIVGAEFSHGNHPEAEVVFPEDGLHPSKRWAVVRVRVAQILRGGHAGPVRIVTHDQGVVAAFGQRIADGLSSVDDVQVQLHRADKVDSLHFRPDGSIKDWTIGFFTRDPADMLLEGDEAPTYVWADEETRQGPSREEGSAPSPTTKAAPRRQRCHDCGREATLIEGLDLCDDCFDGIPDLG